MTNTKQLFRQLNKADLLPIQQKLVKKLEQNPFEISKKTTYEPLYNLLKTLFITEYPNFNVSKRDSMNILIEEIVLRLKEILPKIKSI